MEVRALCIRLMMKVLFLLVTQDEVCCSVKDNDAFPQIVPNRQQFFEYESIIVSCEGLMGLTGWRVLKRMKGESQPCAETSRPSTGPCKIKKAFPSLNTGKYWCETGALRTISVNIKITAGSVILEIPVLPVAEGDNVTLRCRNKRSSPNIIAQFFKDGDIMGTSHTGTISIDSVFRSHEGLYKCRISGEGESPQSWLTVREAEEDPRSLHQVPNLVPLHISISVFKILVVLFLPLGLLLHKICPTVNRDDTTTPRPSAQYP